MKNYKKYSLIGMRLIIGLMLFVVLGNGLVILGSAITSYGFPTPNELEYPAWVNLDSSVDHAFIGHNNYNVTTYFGFDSNASNSGGVLYTAQNRFYSNNMVRFAVVDWAHPQRLFLVFSNLDVAYTDSIGGPVTYENGYYADNVWPIEGCSNCNDLHKIGVLTSLNSKITGFVDSNGDLLLAEGTKIVKFVRTSEYTKTTYLTASSIDVSISNPIITSMASSSEGGIHVLIGGYYDSGNSQQKLQHQYYLNGLLTKSEIIYTVPGATEVGEDLRQSSLLIPVDQTNTSNIVVGFLSETEAKVYLRYYNQSGYYDICPNFCGTITGMDGLQIYSGFAYIASSAENKIYRFPTTINVSSGNGFGAGGLGGVVSSGSGIADYSNGTATISADPATIHNNSDMRILFTLHFKVNETNAIQYLSQIGYSISLFSPTGLKAADDMVIGVTCTQNAHAWWDVLGWGALLGVYDSSYSCSGSTPASHAFFVSPPVAGWDNGSYTANLNEVFSGTKYVLYSIRINVLNVSGFTGISNPVFGLPPNSISTSGSPTMDNIIYFLSLPAFWGILIFVFVVIAVAWKAPSAVGIVALIISNLEAIIGLWSPYTIYVFIVTWIIAAIFFTLGRDATTGGSKT